MPAVDKDLDVKAKFITNFWEDMESAAKQYSPKFAQYGLAISPYILFATALHESRGTKQALTFQSFDVGLGLMQLTPYKGKFNPKMAEILNWDNSRPLEYNIEHSKWRDAKANIYAAAEELLSKSRSLSVNCPAFAQLSHDDKWRYVMYAYNTGQSTAIDALNNNKELISRFKYKGVTQERDYVGEWAKKLEYAKKKIKPPPLRPAKLENPPKQNLLKPARAS